MKLYWMGRFAQHIGVLLTVMVLTFLSGPMIAQASAPLTESSPQSSVLAQPDVDDEDDPRDDDEEDDTVPVLLGAGGGITVWEAGRWLLKLRRILKNRRRHTDENDHTPPPPRM